MFASQEEEEIEGGDGREGGEQQTAESNNSGAPMRANMNIDTRQLADGGRPLLPPAASSGESFSRLAGRGAP